jgi:hypothetical protein
MHSPTSLDFPHHLRILFPDIPLRVLHWILTFSPVRGATVLIPVTFPIEGKDPEQGRQRIGTILQSAISDHASFYAYMTFSSAHHAITSGQHSDLIISGKSIDRHIYSPDYLFMKAKTISLLNDMMRDPEQATSDAAFEAVYMLWGTTVRLSKCRIFLIFSISFTLPSSREFAHHLTTIKTTVGAFDEGRMHAKGLLKMIQLRGGITSPFFLSNPRILFGIIVADSKACCGTLAKPAFPIPWPIEPISPSILDRISPPLDSPLYHLASAFTHTPILSPTIVSLLLKLRDLAYFDDWNARDAEGLSASEYELYRVKAHETEHQLLSYPYDAMASQQPKKISEIFHPLEMITRTAAIVYILNTTTVALPQSGILRALVLRFKRQLQQLQFQPKARPPVVALDLLTWCLFLGAQSTEGYPERSWFVGRLAEVVRLRGWIDWEEAEGVMEKLLYERRVNEHCWRRIWYEAQHVNEEEEDDE